MIRWLVQTVVDHPDLSALRPPAGLLTPAELVHYTGYLSPHRRRDWLVGRWTAKRLVQQHFAMTVGFSPAFNLFSIANAVDGAPYVASTHPALGGTGADGRVPLAISISHSHGYALCAVGADEMAPAHIGIDIELVEPRPESFTQEFFTATEQVNVDSAPPALRDLLITATWSAKESAFKASHLGPNVDPRYVACSIRPARPCQWTPLRVALTPTARAQSGIASPLRAWWRVLDNRLRPDTMFVLTLVAYGTAL